MTDIDTRYRAATLRDEDQRLWLVPFYIGDGAPAILLSVSAWAEFLRGPDGTCAFCHGDPCAQRSEPGSLIATFFRRNQGWAQTCPCCDGRPT